MAEKNLKVLVPILINGAHFNVGDVVAKSDFADKADWQNLAYAFDPPRLEETDEPEGKAGDDAPAKPAKAATRAAMPGA